jgi:hypothetical protein
MQITEHRLRQIIIEEAQVRFLNEIIEEELYGVLFESDEDVVDQWKNSQTFRTKVKNALRNFDELPSIKKKTVIMILGALGALATQLTAEFAHDDQKREIRSQLRQSKKAYEDYRFGSFEEIKHFRDAATAEGDVVDEDDAEGIEKVKRKFLAKGAALAPIVSDRAIALRTGTQQFVYTPASRIPGDEWMPFVGMTKENWESLLRDWLTDTDGRKYLEKFVGTEASTHATFWAYASDGQMFSHADEEEQYMWLPPEWSVAYDIIQRNKSRAGQRPSDDSTLSISDETGLGTWKETLEKYLTSLL